MTTSHGAPGEARASFVSHRSVDAFVDDVLRPSDGDRPDDAVVARFLDVRLRRVLAFLAAGTQDALAAEVQVSDQDASDLSPPVRTCLAEDVGVETPSDPSALSRHLHADLFAQVRVDGGFGPGWARVVERDGRLVMVVAAVTQGDHLDDAGVEVAIG